MEYEHINPMIPHINVQNLIIHLYFSCSPIQKKREIFKTILDIINPIKKCKPTIYIHFSFRFL